jgi:hypothetical protein
MDGKSRVAGTVRIQSDCPYPKPRSRRRIAPEVVCCGWAKVGDVALGACDSTTGRCGTAELY